MNQIRKLLYEVTPYVEVNGKVYRKDSSEFKKLAKNNSDLQDKLKFDKSQEYFDLLFGNSSRFKNIDNFKNDIDVVSK
jgi:hypothetical protein